MTHGNQDGILSLDELGPDEERVRSLDENRYLVGAGTAADPSPATDGGADSSVESQAATETTLRDGAYAFALRARFGTEVEHTAVGTNSVSEAFESMVRWYTRQVADGTPVEEVVAVLVADSDLNLDVAPAGTDR
jgi:hypothetical protein